MRIINLTICLLAFLISKLNAQGKIEISFVDVNKAPITDVIALINSKYYSTDKDGKVFINEKSDKLYIKATALGYLKIDTTIEVSNNNFMEFEMKFINELPTIEIQDNQIINRSISKNIITAADIKRTFPLLGEKDPMKTLQMMPGVVFAQEGTASIYVRGGNPGENLILLDNVPLYNANHFFGLVSTINPDIISSMEFFKGGFPAQYNDRVSSVIDIKTKEGKSANQIKIGLLSTSLFLTQPLLEDKISISANLRTSPLSALIYTYNKIKEANSSSAELFNTSFYDSYFKLNYKISAKSNLNVSYFKTRDEIYIKNFGPIIRDSTKLNWSNNIFNFGMKTYLGFGIKNETNLYTTDYSLNNLDRYNFANGGTIRTYDYSNNIKEIGLKTKFTIPINFQTKLRIGASIQNQGFKNNSTSKTLRLNQGSEDISKNFIFSQDLLNTYISFDGFLFKDLIKFDLGLNRMQNLSSKRNIFEPRINASLNKKKVSFLYSFHRVSQNISLITPEAIGIPFQIWLPPENNNQIIISNQQTYGSIYRSGNFEFSLEGYIKRVINLNYPGQGQDIRIVDPFSSEILKGGRLNSKGLEFFVKGLTRKNTIQFSYTLSRSKLFFENYNKNKPFRQNTDRLHIANLSLEHSLNKRWTFNTVLVYHSSYPVTIPEILIPSISYNTLAFKSKFSFNELFLIDFKGNGVNRSILYDIETVNNGQSKSYFRFDLNARKKIIKEGKIKAELSFGIYNVTLRKNPFVSSITDNINGELKNKLLLSSFSLFNFIPFINYEKYF